MLILILNFTFFSFNALHIYALVCQQIVRALCTHIRTPSGPGAVKIPNWCLKAAASRRVKRT